MNADPVNCRACDHTNPPGSRFCNACGSSLAVIRPIRTQRRGEHGTGALPSVPQAAPVASPNSGQPTAKAAAPSVPAPSVELVPGTTIDPGGRYTIKHTIGRGGFGEAYLVFDRHLSRYCVAKRQVPNPAWSPRTRELALRNFQREAQLLVTLNTPGHPNIPEIYEYLPEQRCLVMKYVEGRDLGQILRDQGGHLAPDEAMTIARDIASALMYMHERQPEPVLHRDVKPANIIIDSSGRVWLIDFGLSRATPVQNDTDPRHTQLAGTLGFTPPEQWRGKAEPRSDIYALSVTLHILLTGFQSGLTRDDLPDFLRGLKNPYPPVRTLDPGLHPEIESLVTRGLAFLPEERPDAEEFLAALEKLLAPSSHTSLQTPDGSELTDEHALVTWAESHWEQATTWLYTNLPDQVEQLWGRNKLAADMRAAVVHHPGDMHAGLDALLTTLDPQNFGTERPRLVADQRALDFGSLALDERRDAWLQLSNTGRRYVQISVQAPRWVVPATKNISLPPGSRQRLKLTADMRRIEESGKLRDPLLLKDRTGANFRVELRAQLSRWRAFLRSVAGSHGIDWEAGNVRPLRELTAHKGCVWALAFSPGGTELVSGGWDHVVRLWRVSDGSLLSLLDERAGNVLNTNFSPDGLLVAVTSSDSGIKIWGARGGKLVQTLHAQRTYQESAYFSYDSQTLITNGNDASITYWRVSDGMAIRHITTVANALSFACRPDGHLLAVGCDDRLIRLYNGEEGTLTAALAGHNDAVNCVAYSLDGSLLVSGGSDGLVCVWDGESGELRQQLRGHQNGVRTVAVHPDGLLVASGGVDGSIRLWSTTNGELRQVLGGHSGGVLRTAFSPAGDMLASSGGDGTVILWQPG